jgi:putative solute:sodium symporter small subunit
MANIDSRENAELRRRYWRSNLRLTGSLMAIWFITSFAAAFYARELSQVFLGWPLSFYISAQGALLVYVLLVWFYARTMRRLDLKYHVAEEID